MHVCIVKLLFHIFSAVAEAMFILPSPSVDVVHSSAIGHMTIGLLQGQQVSNLAGGRVSHAAD